jgi:hypothetical protein
MIQLAGMKKLTVGLVFFVALAAIAVLILRSANSPPSNDVVAKAFNENKPEYVQLRNMLLADKPIASVAPWGVSKIGGPSSWSIPPIPEMPSERYQSYLNLLSRLGAKLIFKEPRQSGSEVCTAIWRAGLGDAIHVWVCWLENDLRQRSSKAPIDGDVYFPLGDRWYVRRDYTW